MADLLTKSNIYLSHPTGNENSKRLAKLLLKMGVLQEFATSLAVSRRIILNDRISVRMRNQLARRYFAGLDGKMNSLAIASELLRHLKQKLKLGSERKDIDSLYRIVDAKAARRISEIAPDAVYCYEDGAFESFKAAELVGATKIYELPIGHWQAHKRIWATEYDLNREWSLTWNVGEESEAKLARKDAELAASDLIVVPSDFVRRTLLSTGMLSSKIAVIPYGCPSPILENAITRQQRYDRLRVLFVGGLSQRKGLSYLIGAIAPLAARLDVTIIGRGPGGTKLPSSWKILDTLPHEQLLAEMVHHDVFIFPTLFEGRSLAVTEAVSRGLILITTENSGAADLVEEGRNGWVVGARDSAAITDRLDFLLTYPDQIYEMKRHSLTVANRNSWSRYDSEMSEFILRLSDMR